MKYAIIKNNKVSNVILANAEFAELIGAVECPDHVSIGYGYDGTFTEPVPVQKSPEDIQAEIVEATQAWLDAFAKTRGYDNILSACTYAASKKPKFSREGQYALNVRDETWDMLYTIMANVMAGEWQMPDSFDDIEPHLPVLVWPA